MRNCALASLLLCTSCAAASPSPFATRVLSYDPAPGQFVRNPNFNNPARALGAPVGGGLNAADNSKIVTLGGFGGSIVLGFDAPVPNLDASAANPFGLDLIIYGNAFYAGGDPSRWFAEAGVIEVSVDANANGLADDAWYVIPGYHLGAAPSSRWASQSWDDVTTNTSLPPSNPNWIPLGRSGQWTTSTYALPLDVFAGPVVENPFGSASPDAGIIGYADCSPTLVLGDFNADGVLDDGIDDATISPERFYTQPDDPFTIGLWSRSGGGDAIDLDWAVTSAGASVTLDHIDFIRISTCVNRVNALFGEASTEISGVAMVRPRNLADLTSPGNVWPPDGELSIEDFIEFLAAFSDGDLKADLVRAGGVLPPDGDLSVDDFIVFLAEFTEGS